MTELRIRFDDKYYPVISHLAKIYGDTVGCVCGMIVAQYAESRMAEIKVAAAATDKVKGDLGLAPKEDIPDGLAEFLSDKAPGYAKAKGSFFIPNSMISSYGVKLNVRRIMGSFGYSQVTYRYEGKPTRGYWAVGLHPSIQPNPGENILSFL